jgi:hypothetical protein
MLVLCINVLVSYEENHNPWPTVGSLGLWKNAIEIAFPHDGIDFFFFINSEFTIFRHRFPGVSVWKKDPCNQILFHVDANHSYGFL